eukprot:756610-Hanusia_phi.AAC.2
MRLAEDSDNDALLVEFVQDNFTTVLDIPLLSSAARLLADCLRAHLALTKVRGYRDHIALLLAPDGMRARRSKMKQEAQCLKEVIDNLKPSTNMHHNIPGQDLLYLSPSVSINELPEAVTREKLQALVREVEDPEDAAIVFRLYSLHKPQQLNAMEGAEGKPEAEGSSDDKEAEPFPSPLPTLPLPSPSPSPSPSPPQALDRTLGGDVDDVVLRVLTDMSDVGEIPGAGSDLQRLFSTSSSSSFFHEVSLDRSLSASSSFRARSDGQAGQLAPLSGVEEEVDEAREAPTRLARGNSWGRIVRVEKHAPVAEDKLVKLGSTTWALEDLTFLPWELFQKHRVAAGGVKQDVDEEEEENDKEEHNETSDPVETGQGLALAALCGSSDECLGWLDVKLIDFISGDSAEEQGRCYATMSLLSSGCKQGAYRTSAAVAGFRETQQSWEWVWSERFRFAIPRRSSVLLVELFQLSPSGPDTFLGSLRLRIDVHRTFVVFEDRAVRLSNDVSRDQPRNFRVSSTSAAVSRQLVPPCSLKLQLCCRLICSPAADPLPPQKSAHPPRTQRETSGNLQATRLRSDDAAALEDEEEAPSRTPTSTLRAPSAHLPEQQAGEASSSLQRQATDAARAPPSPFRAPTLTRASASSSSWVSSGGGRSLEVSLRKRVMSALRSASHALHRRKGRERPVSRYLVTLSAAVCAPLVTATDCLLCQMESRDAAA